VELNTPNRVSAKALLPTALVNKAAKRELLLDLHPETLITILFIDIVGFWLEIRCDRCGWLDE